MALLAKAGGSGDFEPVPEGTHVARCVSVVDFGLQDSGKWGPKHKVWIAFEVPSIRVAWKDKEGQEHQGPAIIGMMQTNSISDKSILGQLLVSWRGRAFTDEQKDGGFDLFTILDVPCMISVTHNRSGDRTYANISGIMGLPKGTEAPPRETELTKYSPHDDSTISALARLPDWMKKRIEDGAALEAQQSESPAPNLPPASDDFDDDIPF